MVKSESNNFQILIKLVAKKQKEGLKPQRSSLTLLPLSFHSCIYSTTFLSELCDTSRQV